MESFCSPLFSIYDLGFYFLSAFMCACCVLSPIIVIGSIGSCFFHWFCSYGILQESKRVISEEHRRPFTIFNSKPPSTPTLSLSPIIFLTKDLKDLMRKAGEVTFADCHKDRHGEGYELFINYIFQNFFT